MPNYMTPEGHVNILDLVSGLCLVYPMSVFQPVAILHIRYLKICVSELGLLKKAGTTVILCTLRTVIVFIGLFTTAVSVMLIKFI